VRLITALIAIASMLLIAVEESPDPSWITRGRVIRVVDGDTVEVEIRRVLRVRLLDCWAPESRRDARLSESRQQESKAKGQASKAHLSALADGKEVILQIPLADDGDVSRSITMGRVLGRVWLLDHPHESLSAMQVQAGHATTTKPEELR
jgi:endonuclease YncB( thermonuclease family)